MKTSAEGRAAIEAREGRRLKAYRDSRGIWTIGVGHTGRMSAPRVTAGMTITEAACDAMLAGDLAPVEAVIAAAVKVPIGQNEFDALASLGFNIGAGGLARSTVIRKLNLGDVAGAADAFMLWDKPAALVGRRTREKAQFLRPESAEASRALVTARASALGRLASQARTTAILAATTAAGTAAIGGAATAGLSAHPATATWIGVGTASCALFQCIVAWLRAGMSKILSANAAAAAEGAAR